MANARSGQQIDQAAALLAPSGDPPNAGRTPAAGRPVALPNGGRQPGSVPGWRPSGGVGHHGDVETVDAPARPAARPAAGGRSARDMALSIAVLIIPIFVLLGVYRVFFAGDAPIAVDAAQEYANAKHDAPFPVLEPTSLPGKWTPISATFGKVSDGWVLRVSYVPPAKTGAQLVESDRPVNALLADELGGSARPGNLEVIDGRTWRQYPIASNNSRALVLANDGQTTIISGTASFTDLHALAAALH
ncbi:hypothetical protein GCM10023322_23730 [Rugosimonospora acidiphila]|uniref:DUF4245 domain-containing protein n=1 Tax=Rugosimonospora acidiphila TaxID=556531 RepID=A0ABP9RRM9_9ACTN